MKHILITLLLLNCSTNLYAQQKVFIDQGFLEREIGSFFDILIDSSVHSQVADVIACQHFYKNEQEILQLGYTKFPVWLKTRLHSRSDTTHSLILEIKNPHINFIRLYLVKSNGSIDSSFQYLGDRQPFHERIIQHRYFLFPIEVLRQDSLELIFEVRSSGEPIYLPVFLYETKYFWRSQQKDSLHYGIKLVNSFENGNLQKWFDRGCKQIIQDPAIAFTVLGATLGGANWGGCIN